MPRNSAALSRAQRPLARRGASAAGSAATASDNPVYRALVGPA